MECALCGSATRRGRPPLENPPSLAGKVVCDWCGQRLEQLANGRLPRPMYDQLLVYANKSGDPSVAADLHALWGESDPDRRDAEEAARASSAAKAAEEAALTAALQSMTVTSSSRFDTATITDYIGFFSSEVVIGMGLFKNVGADFADFFGTEAQGLSKKLQEAKAAAFLRLRRDVHQAGGNAIVGIDLDYAMFGSSVVGVIASGTGVVIEHHGS